MPVEVYHKLLDFVGHSIAIIHILLLLAKRHLQVLQYRLMFLGINCSQVLSLWFLYCDQIARNLQMCSFSAHPLAPMHFTDISR